MAINFKSKLILSIVLGSFGILCFPSVAQAAQFSFDSSNIKYSQGCETDLRVIIDPEGIKSNGADLIVRYNQNELEIIDTDPSLQGIQISTGDAYEVYFGNLAENGTIRIGAASYNKFLNQKMTFATIKLKSKPGTTSSKLTFSFTPGSTLDSNIAEANSSNDKLYSAKPVTINFDSTPCTIDQTGPEIIFINPNRSNHVLNSLEEIVVNLKDTTGVDLNTLEITLNNEIYSILKDNLSYSGSPNEYNIKFTPQNLPKENTALTLKVEISDTKGNNSNAILIFNLPQGLQITTCNPEQPDKCVISDNPEKPLEEKLETFFNDITTLLLSLICICPLLLVLLVLFLHKVKKKK